ncbi:MAG: formimidoylglutamate deiminase [Magnetovibrio sp.]|nr:formimidoylglutamate deiminase [Magnetovibrio sp.]
MIKDIQYLWLENVYLPGKWQTGVRLGVDAIGNISSVSFGEAENSDELVNGIIIPGVPNVHSHAFQRAAAGLTETRPFENSSGTENSFLTWRKIMHDFVTQITPDDQFAIASQLYLEMLKAGYTAVGEFHYLHLDPTGNPYRNACEIAEQVVQAAEQVGIGITLLPALYSVGGYGNVSPNQGQRRYILAVDTLLKMVEALAQRQRNDGNGQVRIGIAPHSIRQVPPKPLADVLDGFAGIDSTGPIHMHIAEQRRDVDAHIEYFGTRPLAWLLDNIHVNSHWCLIHATHIDQTEIKSLASSGAVAGLCPTTEANLGDGLFPFSAFLEAGGTWGIGSDSHVSVSPIEELRWLEYGQRLIRHSRNISAPKKGGATGARLYREALKGGAQALSRSIGILEPGYRADLLVLDPSHVDFATGREDELLNSLVFSGNSNPILHVMCGGKWVIRNGHHPEEEIITNNYKATIGRLRDMTL